MDTALPKLGVFLEDLSRPSAARLKIANDEYQIALTYLNEYGVKLSDMGSMEEYLARARGPLRHALRKFPMA